MASRGCLCWGLAIFSNPLGPAGLRTLPKLGWPHLVPRWVVFQLHQRGVSPLTNSSAGGEEYVHGAGIPSEKALVRGAEGQRRMESLWCSHSCSYCGFSCSSCRRWGPWPIPPGLQPPIQKSKQRVRTTANTGSRALVRRHPMAQTRGHSSAGPVLRELPTFPRGV